MKTKTALLVAVLLGATPALAQTGTPAPADRTPAKADAYHATLDQRIATMHQQLQITQPQEAAWGTFAQTMRDNAETIQQAYKKRADTLSTMNASENLHDFAQIEQDRAQNVQKLSAAFDTLYGQLSDPQKKTADTMFRHYDMGGHGRRHMQPSGR